MGTVHCFVYFSGIFLNEKKSIEKGGRVNTSLHERLRAAACGGISGDAFCKSTLASLARSHPRNLLWTETLRGRAASLSRIQLKVSERRLSFSNSATAPMT